MNEGVNHDVNKTKDIKKKNRKEKLLTGFMEERPLPLPRRDSLLTVCRVPSGAKISYNNTDTPRT